MANIFDGHTKAREYAEITSRREQGEYLVFKTSNDGIKYEAVKIDDKDKVKGKILDHYKDGKVVK